jgi:hypothetical protein
VGPQAHPTFLPFLQGVFSPQVSSLPVHRVITERLRHQLMLQQREVVRLLVRECDQ